ncbi:hypothetical protein JHK87_012223 [Glycine soja]|nr:hypothetical protein JHK87_012223 [Glycine soja]
MPQHEYYEYFGPDYTLHVAPSNMENKNSRHLLEEIRSKLLENLSKLQHAPSINLRELLRSPLTCKNMFKAPRQEPPKLDVVIHFSQAVTGNFH